MHCFVGGETRIWNYLEFRHSLECHTGYGAAGEHLLESWGVESGEMWPFLRRHEYGLHAQSLSFPMWPREMFTQIFPLPVLKILIGCLWGIGCLWRHPWVPCCPCHPLMMAWGHQHLRVQGLTWLSVNALGTLFPLVADDGLGPPGLESSGVDLVVLKSPVLCNREKIFSLFTPYITRAFF